jgi:16S rRNA (guanine966-N2)-methyltransferase
MSPRLSPHRSSGAVRPGRLRIIGGAWRGRSIAAGDSDAIRPTADRVREALFNRLAHGFRQYGFALSGARVLDAFAGTGALGLEALSRGAAQTVFIERDAAAAQLIRRNIASLGAEDRALMVAGDACNPPRASLECDLLLADPPYDDDVAGAALVAMAKQGWLKPGALAAVETKTDRPALHAEGFTTLDQRRYGRAAISFLLFEPPPSAE